MIKNITYSLFTFFILLTSCKKSINDIGFKEDNSLLFTTKIAGKPQTRVTGNQWDMNDSISVFMYQGSTMNATNIYNNGFNKKYITRNGGNFLAANPSEVIVLPEENDETINFAAFYPYINTKELNRVLNVEHQQNSSAIDFMFGQSNSTVQGMGGLTALTFERLTSKIQLKIKGSELSGLKGVLASIYSKATFDLTNKTISIYEQVKSDVNARVSMNSQTETLIEWTIFDKSLTSNSQIQIIKQDGSKYHWNIASNLGNIEKGTIYQFEITLGDDVIINPNPKVSYMEIPVVPSNSGVNYSFRLTPDRSKRNFTMLYDTKNRMAHWVAYPLSGDYLGGQSRTDNWASDPLFSYAQQPLLSKGFGINGIDRGHQLPSGDRTKNYAENSTTFYYTNMTPQVSSMNQGVWASLENKIRSWTTQSSTDTMYVVTGASLLSANNQQIQYVRDNAGNEVAKPKYYYKALAMKRGSEYYTIGFKINNEAIPNNANYMDYTITVDQLEKETGYTFFPGLSASQKTSINTQIWKK